MGKHIWLGSAKPDDPIYSEGLRFFVPYRPPAPSPRAVDEYRAWLEKTDPSTPKPEEA